MSNKHKIEVFFGYVLLLVVIVTGKITMVNNYGKIISPVVNYTLNIKSSVGDRP